MLEALEREIKIVGRFQHPYLVCAFDVFRDDKHVHIVQELGRGGNLLQKVWDYPHDPDEHATRMGLPVELCARYMYQMLEGLRYLHANRVVHRDVKPENYMVKRRGDDSPVMLIDFGFACELPEDGGQPRIHGSRNHGWLLRREVRRLQRGHL